MTDSRTDGDRGADLEVRPPLQERTRRSWARILDAGVALVEQGGYEAFTISAVCERARVAPRAVYDRTTSKDALFLAVYDHGVERIAADHEVFDRPERWTALDAPALVAAAVAELCAIFARHAPFLRPVVLLSGAHPEVRRRGQAHVHRLADQFTGALMAARGRITHPDPELAARLCFATVFSALVLRVGYGADFAAPAVDDAAFVAHLADTATRYLLAAPFPG